MIEAERRAALERLADEVRACRRCRLHEGRTQAVPGEGHPSTEVVFVGEGPGQNEDRQGRPFVGRAGDLLVELLGSIGWRREDVFITNIVKCRPPDNRDPAPDEIAACLPFLQRQLEVLDPALVVALGRHSLGRFMPGATISRVHGTVRPADPSSGVPAGLVLAMYHPAAGLRSPVMEEACRADARRIPAALEEARARRQAARADGARSAADAGAAGSMPDVPAETPAGPVVTRPEAVPLPEAIVLLAEAVAPPPEAADPGRPLEAAEAGMPSDPAASVTPEAIPLFLQPPADEPADDQLTLF